VREAGEGEIERGGGRRLGGRRWRERGAGGDREEGGREKK
jgi:hypothetical protein